MKHLWAPWRISYILGPKPDECVFCLPEGREEDEERLVLHRGKRCFVIMNKYPYNNGHIMVCPYRHVMNLADLDADTIHELYGPVLEELAEMEHERWMRDKRREGWRYGPLDREMKTSPELVPYEELEESTREFIRLSVRDFPTYLNMIGYELYRKSFM